MRTWICLTVLLGFVSSCATDVDKHSDLREARAAFEEKDFESASRFLDRHLRDYPNDQTAFLFKVKTLSRQGEFTRAHELLHSRISTRPHSSELNLALMDWHLEFGSRRAALAVGQKLISRDPSNVNAHRKLIELSLEFEDWKSFETSLRVVHSLDPLDGASALMLGKFFLKNARYDEALAVLLPLTKSPAFRNEAGKFAAWIYAEKGFAREANKFLQELSLSESEDPFVRKIITRNLLNSSDVNRITVLTSYLKQNSDEWGNHLLYLELLKAGLREDALDHLAHVWNKSPGSKWAAINYARHLAESGDHEVAKSILIKASEGASSRDQELISQALSDFDKGPVKIMSRTVAMTSLRTHEVKSGDTLQTISQKYFGTVKRWDDIWNLNRLSLPDSSTVRAGLILQIPEGSR